MEITRKTIFKSFIWKYFERTSTQIASFIITIILARLLLPEEYGAVALITIFINLCNVIIDGGFNTALIQKKEADTLDFSTIFHFSLILAIILYSLLFISAPIISDYFNCLISPLIIRCFALNIIFYAINSIQRAYVAKKMLFNKLFYSSFSSVFISGLIGIIMAYKGYGIWALIAQSISSQFIICIVMWFTIKWKPLLEFSTLRFKSLFNYGWKIFLSNIITTGFIEIRKLIIGKMYTPIELAYYEKGQHFPDLIMNNLYSSVQTILLPTFSEEQNNKRKVKSMMRRATKLCCFFIYPLMIGMIVTAKPLVSFLLTEKWLPIVPFIQIMCLANFFRPITISNWEAIKALGHSDIILKLELIKKIIDVAILIISCILGVYAIAWGMVLFNFICIFINLSPNIKLLDYKIYEQLLDAVPTLVISLIMGFCIFWIKYLRLSDFATFSLQFFVGVSIYLLVCKILKEESFTYIIDILRSKKTNYNKI